MMSPRAQFRRFAWLATAAIALPGSRFGAPLAFAAGASEHSVAQPDDKTVAKQVVEMRAKQKERRFYMAVGIGTDFDYGATQFTRGVSVPFFAPLGIPVGGSATYITNATLRRQRYTGVYPYRFAGGFYCPQLELGFAVNRQLEIFGTFAHARAAARNPLAVGEVSTVTIGTPATRLHFL